MGFTIIFLILWHYFDQGLYMFNTKVKFAFYCSVFFFLFPLLSFAQMPKDVQRKIKKAEYLIYEKKYERAEKLYAQAITLYPRDLQVFTNYLKLFELSNKAYKRKEVLQKIVNQNNPRFLDIAAIPFLQLLIEEEDRENLNYYLPILKFNLPEKHPAQAYIQLYSNASYTDPNVRIYPLGEGVEEDYDLQFPQFAFQEQKLIFTRLKKGKSKHFAISEWDSCYGWMSTQVLDIPFNGIHPTEGMNISWDGRYMFFTKCDQQVIRAEHGGKCDIYFSFYQNGYWSRPEVLGPNINTIHDDIHPVLSVDQKTLYFASNRPGGYGGYDLYMSKYENYEWQEAVNLGPLINSSGNEIAPFLSASQNELFYSSNGLPGYGGYDIFKATKTDDSWDSVENLGMPINSIDNELGATVRIDGSELIFSSDRAADNNGYNLYSAIGKKWSEDYQLITGFVIDSIGYYQLPNAGIKDLYHTQNEWPDANRGDGSYFIIKEKSAKNLYRFSYPGFVDREILFYNDSMNYVNQEHIALLHERVASHLMDTLVIQVPYSKFQEDFWLYFQHEWPDVFSYLNKRKMTEVHVFKSIVNFDEEVFLFFEDEEKETITSQLSPLWISEDNIHFENPSDDTDLFKSTHETYIELEIISQHDSNR